MSSTHSGMVSADASCSVESGCARGTGKGDVVHAPECGKQSGGLLLLRQLELEVGYRRVLVVKIALKVPVFEGVELVGYQLVLLAEQPLDEIVLCSGRGLNEETVVLQKLTGL